ncbi:hypothetical protein ACQY0O_002019 [Thecaphora frezii]
MKVKLRVPLSTAPRETASPLSNAMSLDDADPDQTADAQASDPDSDDDDDEDDEEGDELDEVDELEDELPQPPAPTAKPASPKRSRITLKPRASKGVNDNASPSPTPSSNAREQRSDNSPGAKAGSATPSQGGSDRPKILTGKKAALARQEEAARMTMEELDALPAAKRRKSHKARGAPGPGRGWRKGLTKGQKPIYELPKLPEAGSTPASFGNTSTPKAAATPIAASAATGAGSPPNRASPAVVKASNADTSSASIKRATPQSSAATTVKVQDASGSRTLVSDLSAKAGTAKNPGFRYPPLPSSRGGPTILPIAKIPIAFQGSIPIDKAAAKREPRCWTKKKREILSLGGRPWSVPTWYGCDDKGYEKKVDPSIAPALGQPTTAGAATPAAAAAPLVAKTTPTPTPTPAPAPAAAAARLSPDKGTEQPDTPLNAASAARRPGTTGTGTGTASPLPPPRHVGALKEDMSWRGQSPAFLAGGR